MPGDAVKPGCVQHFGRFEIDEQNWQLLRDGEAVLLTPKAFDLLLLLTRNNGRTLSKEEIMGSVWAGTFVEETSLTSTISRLRKILHADGERYIETLPKRGYRFKLNAQQGISTGVESGQRFTAHIRHTTEEYLTEETIEESSVDQVGEGFARRRRILPASAVILVLFPLAFVLFYYVRPLPPDSTPIRSLAVLTFKPIVVDDRDEALEFGIADALISTFAKESGLIVRPLSSVRQFANRQEDAQAVGRRLGVDSVLDGSIQRAGDRIRVNVRVIRVADGHTLLAESFNEEFTHIFDVEDAIAEKVSRALSLKLGSDTAIGNSRRATNNVDAYQLYLKGRYHSEKLTREDSEKGVAYYSQAIEADPDYALAYVGLAGAYVTLPLASDYAPIEYFTLAKAAAEKAIKLDEHMAEAHAMLGWIAYWYDWDWSRSIELHERALALEPNDPDTLRYYAHVLSSIGRHDEAFAQMGRAIELDPVNLRTGAQAGQILLHGGHVDKAIVQLQQVLDLEPRFWLARLFLASALIEKGQFEEAAAEAQTAANFSASLHPLTFRAYALARGGDPLEATRILDELLKRSAERFVPPYYVALIYYGLGDTDETLAWLDRGVADRDPKMVFLYVEPKWQNLRMEPRFQELLHRMKFE